MQTFDPIVTGSKFNIQTRSPIQELEPMVSFQGQ
jgi:hypothetical protein